MADRSETYTKIFSDTEGSKYRANDMTGAYVDTYHPYNGNIYMVNSKQQEAQNGWYQIFVTAESYAESAEEPNSKMAWVKGDFCKVVDLNEDNNSVTGMMIPAAVYYDMETGTTLQPRASAFLKPRQESRENTPMYVSAHTCCPTVRTCR